MRNELRTERLLLRRWRASDLEPFAALNADPRVMEFFPAIRSREESAASIANYEAHFEEHGFGLWAVEVPGIIACAGLTGICCSQLSGQRPIVEIGWRLAYEQWDRGYATEAARAALAFGFEQMGLDEIVSFTAVPNLRSQRVMQKLGMVRNPSEDFDHPKVPEGNWLRRHVLYRIAWSEFVAIVQREDAMPAAVSKNKPPTSRRLGWTDYRVV